MTRVELKLHKTLLLLLCSTIPGEVVAARDALLRLAGIGPHELAARLLKERPKEKPKWQAPPPPEHQRMAQEILAWQVEGGRLSAAEQGFITDMLDWKRPTEKQMAWLEKIYQRVQGTKGW